LAARAASRARDPQRGADLVPRRARGAPDRVSVAAGGGLVGSQTIFLTDATQQGEGASLRTNVSEQCQAAMIELHGQEAWDTAVAERAAAQDAAAAAAVGKARTPRGPSRWPT
jgi:hypothetical protein